MVANPEKSTSDCLMLLIKELGKLPHSLREALQTVEYLHDKLVTTCQGVPACRYAISDPPPSLGAFINKLQSSIIAYEKENAQSAAFSTDRRYHINPTNSRTNNVVRRCYKRFKQYTVDCWGSRDDDENDLSKTELDDAFDSLVVNFTENSPEIDPNDRTANFFCTSYGQMGKVFATSIVEELSNRVFNHSLTASNSMNNVQPQKDEPFTYNTRCVSRYTTTKFTGIMIDTGASNRSTAGYAQFLALQKITNVQLDKSSKDLVNVQFGIGSTSSSPQPKKYQSFSRFGHPFLLWDTSLHMLIQDSFAHNPCYLKTTELKRLHRRFGHPSVDRLYRILNRAGYDDNNNHREILRRITQFCHHCQKYGGSLGRFKFTLKDDVRFNYCIVVDIMYIDGSPLLHVIDESTKFQAGRWLQNLTAKHTWDMLCTCWIDTYIGPPDIISHDAGKNFTSREFQEYALSIGTKTKRIPVEAHHSIDLVERYHGPLRRIYKIIIAEIPGINKNLALQMTFKALNDTAGPDGLVPTLLVFGAYPRMTE
ncbi:hypothetical protein K3495_g12589 [Podosphaera aphanis]|nr:hypothetical protein K3495_g12589 [Podosphaera aphanis]